MKNNVQFNGNFETPIRFNDMNVNSSTNDLRVI